VSTNDIKFNVKNGLAVGASGFEVINSSGEWVGASGAGQSPYGATGAEGTIGTQGASGPDGAQGTLGDTGVDGATGHRGIDGASGPAGIDGATGATGFKGATGSIGQTGPDGDQGVQGDQGTTGTTGDQGPTGPDGDQGITGNVGIDGASGPTGEIGATGPNGDRFHTTSTTTLNLATGATGVVVVDDYLNYSVGQTIILVDGGGKHIHASVDSYNPTTKILAFTPIDHVGSGSASSWEINLDGAEGPQGASGVTGQDGVQGIDGHIGTQGASGLLGATGADGEQGTVGLTGATGVAGATGSIGITGDDGATGYTGATGADGYQGATGPLGDSGIVGEQGEQGVDGATGVIGSTGAQGGDGSGEPGESYSYGDDWSDMAWTGSGVGIPVSKLEFSNTESIYNELSGLNIGDTITIDWTHGSGQITPQTVTIQSSVQSGGSYQPFWIQVSEEPDGGSGTILISNSSPLDTIVVASGPTNTGYTGVTGATGAQGDVGNAGYDADQLTTGNARGAWDISTTYYPGDIVVTIPADSHRCIVENTGFYPDTHPEYWVWTAWAGASGATGYHGATGIDGASGVQGTTGAQGIDGASGVQGTTGAQGIDGASGPTGPDGEQGATGAVGTDGASGPTGETGTDGATGSHGLQFKATANGNFSISDVGTYQLAVPFQADPNTGNTFYNYSVGQGIVMAKDANNYMFGDITATDGTYIDFIVTRSVGNVTGVGGWTINLDGSVGVIGVDGATGLVGATGHIGASGATGFVGDQGATGADGEQGHTGSTGATGVVGADGDQGIFGDQGSDGDQGATGPNGEQGDQGIDGDSGVTGVKGFSLVTGSTGLSTTSLTAIDMFAADVIGTAKYLVQGVDGSTNVQATQVILTQNNSSVFLTEYATLRTGNKVMDVTATTDGSIISLKVTPTTSNTTFSWVREDVVGRIG